MQSNFPGARIIEGGVYQGKGVGWPLGVDSFSHPLFVNELSLRWLENAVTQGGFVQTRPGLKTALSFDATAVGSRARQWWLNADAPLVHPQMLHEFTTDSGQKQLVFAVSGAVFYAVVAPDGSMGDWTQIPGFSFNPNADQLVGCACVQSATIIAGLYANNITPRNLLIIQDGANRAGVWDGLTGTHLNPAKKITVTASGDTLYPEAWNQTRIGLWMAWSGNRLWIGNGPNVYASDLNDPLHFTEELKLQSAPFFNFPGDITGMVDRGTSGTNRSQVVVFTASTTWTLWSGVQNRLPSAQGVGWAFTDDFMVKIFGAVGCVAGKSVIIHRGLLYWKSKDGIVMFDGTSTVNSTQNLPPIDNEMAYSKMRVSPPAEGADLTCAGKSGSYVLWGVPVGKAIDGRRTNSQIQVLDRQTTMVRSTGIGGAFQAGPTGWQGVWTGIRPVEFASVQQGVERIYALSLDAAGVVRIWQAFQANRADNGRRIPWLVETRVHPVQPSIFEYGIFRHFRLLLDQISGNLEVVGMWRGLKGTYHEQLTKTITATPGSFALPLSATVPIPAGEKSSFGMQSRTVISRNLLGPHTDCTSIDVESQYTDATDHAFGLALRFTGRGALTAYVIAAGTKEDNSEGTAMPLGTTGVDETGFNLVPQGGCPQHIAGTTPDYFAPDQPNQIGACPYVPSQALGFEYEAPTS